MAKKNQQGNEDDKDNDDSVSDDEYFEPDEEELEEEREDAAAKLIQGLYRAKRARRIIRELVKANFVKEVDSLTGSYIYRNRRTGHVSRRKPVFLGNEDLETPRTFAPPEGYDAGESAIPQFALVITNRLFESPKIPDIPEQVEGDHDAIRDTLQHPYYAKFESENCFFVKNAPLEVLKASLASVATQVSATVTKLRREAEKRAKVLQKEREGRVAKRYNDASAPEDAPSGQGSDWGSVEGTDDGNKFDPEDALLFVYICTHAAEITKGKGTAGTYLVTSDTSWKSKEAFAKSALRLETLADAIAGIQIRHKVLFLDVVHTAKEHGGFKTRHLYPSRDFYDRAAHLCGSVVVGSCRIGGSCEVDFAAVRKEAVAVWDAPKRRRRRKPSTAMGESGKGKERETYTSGSDNEGIRSGNSCRSSSTSTNSNSRGYSESSKCEDSTKTERSGGGSAGSSDGDNDRGSTTDSGSSSSSSSSSSDGGSRRSSGDTGGDNGRAAAAIRYRDRRNGRRGKGTRGGGGDNRHARSSRRRAVRSRSALDCGSNDRGLNVSTNPSSPGRSSVAAGMKVSPGSAGDGGVSKYTTGNEPGGIEGGGGGGGGEWPQYEKTKACVPVYDRAIYKENKSVFGTVVTDAVLGECIEEGHHERVLMIDLYKFLRHEFCAFEKPREVRAGGNPTDETGSEARKRKIETLAGDDAKVGKGAAKKERQRGAKLEPNSAAEEALREKETAQRTAEEAGSRRQTQMPVLAGPSIAKIAQATVCAAPSPPPAPVAPVPVDITRTSVRLAWRNPPFDGEAPLSYELESRGDLRNNGRWRRVFPRLYPKVVAQPLNVPHRVPGLGLRYRVRAFNHGGWGEYSIPSELITTKPTLEETAQNTAGAMATLARTGGSRFILARMSRYSSSLLVQEEGFHQLLGEVNKSRGIPRASLAKEVAIVVTQAMVSFSQVRSIQSSGLLLLGWAARGKGGGDSLPADLVKKCLALVDTAVKLHSMDVAVTSHASWARANLKLVGGGIIVTYNAANEDSWTETASCLEQAEGD